MARKKRKGVLDWWQTVIDETKDFLDDSIDRLRDDDDDDDVLAKDVTDLKRSIAELNAKLDLLMTTSRPSAKIAP
jgi:hypothetical protein